MILLSGHSLTQARRVPVESLSLSLKERESTATMVPADMEGISTESWFQDDTEPGKGIVWRVSSIQQQFALDTPTVQLEHVINVLRDRILFGEITASDMGGGETCTAEQAIRYVLRQQSDWRLGTFAYSTSGPYKFNGDNLFEAIQRVSDSLEDPWWTFDTTSYPFTLNIIRKPDGVACEMRPGRNLSAVTQTIDRTGMYTRFYPIGKDDLHIPGNYVSKNENLYGVICKSEVDQALETEAALRARANDRLRKHAQPTVEVQAEGVELADATGESIDKLTLGRICRIPLAEFNTTIEERIVGLEYRDKVHQPENVRITLSNKSDDAKMDLIHVLANEIREGGGPSGRGGGGRGAAQQAKEDHAWFEDTDHHVAMCAEGIVGVDAEGNPNWTRLSQLIVDENGIHGSVQSIQEGLVIAQTAIEQNEEAITLEATRATEAEGELSSRIRVAADEITAEVTRAKSAEGSLSSRITINAQGIETKVSKNGVISAINQTAESVTISASRIDLDGYVTASQLGAVSARIDNLMSGTAVASLLSATTVSASVLKVANTQASWKLANIPGYGYLNYLGA